MNMFNFIELNNWNEIGSFNVYEYKVFKTPNNLYFMIMRDKCNTYGAPTYRLYMNNELDYLFKKTKYASIGRYNNNKGYHKFVSYNVGYDLSNYFTSIHLDLKIEEYEFFE